MNSLYDEVRVALHMVWHRRWLALAVVWGVCLVGWMVIAMIPNRYESQARVSVQMQSLLPGKVGGMSLPEQQADIDRVRQTLASTVNLEKVVRGTDLGQEATTDRAVADKVETLRKAIKVVAQQDNLFQITAESANSGMSDAENAKLSRDIVQKLIDIFVEENMAGDRDESTDTLRFLDAQLAQREKQLQEAEQKRSEFESKYLGLLPGTGSISQRIESSRAELSSIDADLASAQSSMAAVNAQIASTPASTPIAGPGGAVGGARGRLAALEGQIADALARGWTESHPDVRAMRAQVASLRVQAAREGNGGGGSSVQNPLYVTLRSMQAEKQAAVAALQSRKSQLQADMGQLAAKQTAEPGVVAEQARINRDYDVLKSQYDKLLQDREDIRLRISVQSDTKSIIFKVIDPPSTPRAPTAPNRPMLLTMILLAGIGAGVGVAFALGQLQTTYATSGRLERASGLPVLGAITEILTDGQRAMRRKKLLWFVGGGGALAAVFAMLLVVEMIQRGMVA